MDLKQVASGLGLSGLDIASRMGISPATASKWLNRRVSIPHNRMIEFAGLLHVSIDELLQPKEPYRGKTTGPEERGEEESRDGGREGSTGSAA